MSEEIIKWDDEEIAWETPKETKPTIPQRLLRGAGREISQFVNAPSMIGTMGGILEGGIETGIRALQPSGPAYPPSPKGQAFQQGIVDPLTNFLKGEVGKNIFTSNLPSGMGNYAIDNPLGTLMSAVPLAPKNIQPFLNPITLASKPIGAIASRYFSNTEAQRLMTSSINIINNKRSLEDIHRTATRALDLGILPDETHLSKLKANMDKIGSQIDDVIKTGATKGDKIDAWKVTEYVDRVKEQFQNKILHDPELDKVLDNIKQAFVLEYGEKIPVDKAQQIKRITQQFYDSRFDRLQSIKDEAIKSLEHGVRIELENKYPALKVLNPTQQENVWLKEGIISSIKQQMKSKVLPGISIYNTVKNKTVDSPMVKARVAIIMDRITKGTSMIGSEMPTATAVPFIAGQVTNPYQQMAQELMGGK